MSRFRTKFYIVFAPNDENFAPKIDLNSTKKKDVLAPKDERVEVMSPESGARRLLIPPAATNTAPQPCHNLTTPRTFTEERSGR